MNIKYSSHRNACDYSCAQYELGTSGYDSSAIEANSDGGFLCLFHHLCLKISDHRFTAVEICSAMIQGVYNDKGFREKSEIFEARLA